MPTTGGSDSGTDALPYVLGLIGLAVVGAGAWAAVGLPVAVAGSSADMAGIAGAEDASLGEILGPGFDSEGIVDAVENVIGTFKTLRQTGERFLDTYRRVGASAFKERLYAR